MWCCSCAAAALVCGQGGIKKRSDFTHELFPFLAERIKKSHVVRLCSRSVGIYLMCYFGNHLAVLPTTLHALATRVILMRSKEPIQHLGTTEHWKRSNSSESGLWGMDLLLMIQTLRIRPCPCSGDISAELRNGNRNKTKLAYWEKGVALSLGLSTGIRSRMMSTKGFFAKVISCCSRGLESAARPQLCIFVNIDWDCDWVSEFNSSEFYINVNPLLTHWELLGSVTYVTVNCFKYFNLNPLWW